MMFHVENAYLNNILNSRPAWPDLDVSYADSVLKAWKEAPFVLENKMIEDGGNAQGNMSFHCLFVSKRENNSGIIIQVCRWLPIAVLGKHESGNFHYLQLKNIDVLPPGDWSNELRWLENLLKQYHVQRLSREDVSQESPIPLPFYNLAADNDAQKSLFSALFYWED